MPRNRLDAIAHTRAMNRANHDLRMQHPEDFACLYADHFAAAREEVRETDGLPFRAGPRPDGAPVIDMERLAARECPDCSSFHDAGHCRVSA